MKVPKINIRFVVGFTIIEMLVTLSIVMLLSLMVINYSRRAESLTNLIRESERIIFNIKLAQSSAMLTLGTSEGQNICGWGVYFDKNNNRYILFKDLCPGNQQYDGEAEKVDNIQLLSNINISDINFNSIVFIPPDPKIIPDPKNLFSTQNAQVKICLANNNTICNTIIITPSGLAYKQ